MLKYDLGKAREVQSIAREYDTELLKIEVLPNGMWDILLDKNIFYEEQTKLINKIEEALNYKLRSVDFVDIA